MMHVILAVIAYILTGILSVRADFRHPFHNRPAYARRPTFKRIFLVVIGWLPLKLMAAFYYRSLIPDLIKYLVSFGLFLAFGYWVSSE